MEMTCCAVAVVSLGFLGLRFLVVGFGVVGLEESPVVAILAEWERGQR